MRLDRFTERSQEALQAAQHAAQTRPVAARGADDEMNRLKDECVSTEHLLLALAGQQQGEAAHMLQEAGVTRERIDAVLEARRPAGGLDAELARLAACAAVVVSLCLP